MKKTSRDASFCTLRAIVVVASLCSTGANGWSVVAVLHLRGFGHPLGATAACPDGRTAIPILTSSGRRAGSVSECVLSVRKLSKAGLDPWRIVQSAKQTIPLVDGVVRTKVTQTVTFRRNGYSETRFVGRLIGGEGRYAGLTGAISGGGSGHDGMADWLLKLRFG
jgi:hypothetical protein